MYKRLDRPENEMRKVSFTNNIMENAYASTMIAFGKTKILCTASISDRVPPFINEEEKGWLSAEYNMLPGSTLMRKSRSLYKPDSRGIEIQRLIARSLRAGIDLTKIPGISIMIDCDVIQADGGTRTASITGGYVVLEMAVRKMMAEQLISENPLTARIASVSAGLVDGKLLLDLEYIEDKQAEVDLNVVMNDNNNFIEVQGTGENGDMSMEQLTGLLKLCQNCINSLFDKQKMALGIEP